MTHSAQRNAKRMHERLTTTCGAFVADTVALVVVVAGCCLVVAACWLPWLFVIALLRGVAQSAPPFAAF